MSGKKRHDPNNDPPGFKFNPETGKYMLVPLDLRALLGDDYKPQHRRSPMRVAKRYMEKDNTPENPHPHKYKKLEYGVRKELFKQPPVEKENKDAKTARASFGVRRSSVSKNLAVSGRPSFISKKTTQPKKGLATISEGESRLSGPDQENGKKVGYAFKLPQSRTPKDLGLKESINIENARTPNEIEFLRIEEMLKTPKTIVESPVSTVCNLFENKMLINVTEEETDENNLEATNINMNTADIIAEIRRVAKKDQELYEDTSKKIKQVQEQQLQHQENFKTILSLVDKLEHNIPSQNHENNEETSAIKRRSLRLKKKSPKVSPQVMSQSGSVAGSPVILKSGDLRKSALTKSLVNNCQKYQIDSPRIQKALDLYNSVRSVGSILLTPKFTREDSANQTPDTKFKKNLSLKVQQQCLLLQGTPVHKTKSERS